MNRMPRYLSHLLVGLVTVGCGNAVGNGSLVDSGASDAKIADNGPQDTGADDATLADIGPADSVLVDAGPDDRGPADTGAPDSGPVDAAPIDAIPADSGAIDTGANDTSAIDTGAVDTGVPDVGVDVPRDARDAGADAALSDAAVDATACTPATETCNGRDDDCDGIIDESACGTHLLVTEVVVAPTDAEFVEVHNPTSAPVDLSNYYVTDAHDYACYLGRACTITGRTAMTLDSTDFVARFPSGTSLPPGGYVTVATGAPAAFAALNGRCPDFYLPSRAVLGDAGVAPLGSCTASRPMLSGPSSTTTIGSTAGLGNAVELVMLFRWDGTAALVEDVDYVFWGTPSTTNIQVDKSGTSVTGSTYRADRSAAMQQRSRVPDTGASLIRCDFSETGERRTGGNGIGGHDETSEALASTWRTTVASTMRDDAGLLTSVNATPGALNDCR